MFHNVRVCFFGSVGMFLRKGLTFDNREVNVPPDPSLNLNQGLLGCDSPVLRFNLILMLILYSQGTPVQVCRELGFR